MAYDVWVVRAVPISEGEWRAYIAASLDLELEEVLEAVSPRGDVIRMASPAGARWAGGVHVAWRRGRLRVSRPDRETFGLLARLARAFQGRVEGEEGEVYDEEGEVVGG